MGGTAKVGIPTNKTRTDTVVSSSGITKDQSTVKFTTLPSTTSRGQEGPGKISASDAAVAAHLLPANNSRPDTILLTRGHSMSSGLRDTVLAFAEDCYKTVSQSRFRCEVWLCLDVSSQTGEKTGMLKHVSERKSEHVLGKTLFIHEYNTAEILKRYPRLQYARDHGARGWSDKSVGLGFHTEAITNWYISLDSARKKAVKYIWVGSVP